MVAANSECVGIFMVNPTRLLGRQFLFSDHGQKAWFVLSLVAAVTGKTGSPRLAKCVAHFRRGYFWALSRVSKNQIKHGRFLLHPVEIALHLDLVRM